MTRYKLLKDRFLIEDYQDTKPFASFLPSVAGVDGKPIWTFFTNVAQCLTSFGVTSKDTPITPFDSAMSAYQNVKIKSFRTFLKIDGKLVCPFFDEGYLKQDMSIGRADFEIEEKRDNIEMRVLYTTVPHENYGALLRKVTLTNPTDHPISIEGLDGLPIFFPHGLSNYCYKELVSLMAAYCEVYGLKEKRPFVKFKTSTADNPEVSESVTGNGFYAFDENGTSFADIVDPELIFGNDPSLLTVKPFASLPFDTFLQQEGQTENKLPCAFYAFKRRLEPKESYTFYAFFGMWETWEEFVETTKRLTPSLAEHYISESRKLIEDLIHPASTVTAYPNFDGYFAQSYLDNNLRGGFPILLSERGNKVYYIYSRKHGDMERDYNAFRIPYEYYSSGPGNFRDVNQNRRNDLFFAPFVGDYNIRLFFNLIQVDGQNPLTVSPEKFVLDKEPTSLQTLSSEAREKLLSLRDGYTPSKLAHCLRDELKLPKEEADALFEDMIASSHEEIQANFGEGYWIDHWTYNVDLLENYSSVFPDKEESLFFTPDYDYFYDPVYVEPRSEKYCLLPDGRIRQYGAINLKKLKDVCEKRGFDITKPAWLTDENGNKVVVDLASKIVNLILIKFSALDNRQMGIEMESEKPGWNDAMNGLPGLFASGLSETVELLRLLRYAEKHLGVYSEKTITFLPEQKKLKDCIAKSLQELNDGSISRFEYWDKVTAAREELRLAYKEKAESAREKETIASLMPLFHAMERVLADGLKRAKEENNGILPTYLVYQVSDYEKTGHRNALGYETVRVKAFTPMRIPDFLEADARALKLADGTISLDTIRKIKASDLYDPKLGIYKTCVDLDGSPFEIGRVHAFTKGWLERECCFLHMDYKYLLGLLEAGYYEEFYHEIKTNWVCNMNPEVYGRWPLEASSFIVPTCNPDREKHGRGFFARLTGANAEFLNMVVLMFAGNSIFTYEDGALHFHLNPKLSADFFDADGNASFLLFSKTWIRYHNPEHLNCYDGVSLIYKIGGKEYKDIRGDLALAIREGRIPEIEVEIHHA